MKIAIHKNSNSFSDRWIEYCEGKGIDYKIVDCYRSDIIQQLSDCDALMWHFNHKSSKDSLFATQLVNAIQLSGKMVFPDYYTSWHFDDKLAQKYLFESIEAPVASTYVFYEKEKAKEWIKNASFPKVFKMRNGSGSENVILTKSKKQAYRLVRKAFRGGFKHYDGWSNLKERVRLYRIGKTTTWSVIKGIIRLFYPTKYARVTGREKGYILFQDFIPGNDSDIRIIVVGNKAFAIKRMVRKNDFRASGSGWVLYEKEHFSDEVVSLSFKMARQLKSQCAAFDFVFKGDQVFVLEISFGFVKEVYDPCVGYWDSDLTWHEGTFNPYGWMVENIVKRVNETSEIANR